MEQSCLVSTSALHNKKMKKKKHIISNTHNIQNNNNQPAPRRNDILYYWKSITIPGIIYFDIKWHQFNLIFSRKRAGKRTRERDGDRVLFKIRLMNCCDACVCVCVCLYAHFCIDFIDKSMCGECAGWRLRYERKFI